MAAATSQIGTIGRGIQFGNLSGIYVTFTATATVYATATGGLPIDLTSVLQQGAPAGFIGPAGINAINPADVIGILPIGMSTNKFLPLGLVVGTPTYTTPPGMSSNDASAVPGFLATCPATFRIFATGNANAAAFAEIADGAVTDTFSFILLVARNGANN